VRLGIVDVHVPREQMTAEALAAWDRAVDRLRAAGAVVEPFAPFVTRENYRDAFAAAAKARGDVAVDPKSPAPTASALFQYCARRFDDPRAAMRRGCAAYRAFYDVLPATYDECEPLIDRPITDDPAGRSFARSRAIREYREGLIGNAELQTRLREIDREFEGTPRWREQGE